MKYFVVYKVKDFDGRGFSQVYDSYEDAEKMYNMICGIYEFEYVYIAKQVL